MSGCPMCGYSTSPEDAGSRAADNVDVKTRAKKKKTKWEDPVGSLPLWVYILTTAIFTAVLAALLFRVF